MLLTIDGRGSKIDRNSVFDCHLSPVSISNDFYPRSSIVLTFSIAAYPVFSMSEGTVFLEY